MKTSLNFNWKYIPNFKSEYLEKLPKEAMEINIPHNAFNVPYNYFKESDYQAIVTYEKIFDTKVNKDRRYFIRFEGLMVKAHIYFNNKDYGEHISTYFPFEIEVTDSIKEKDNRLVVVLDSHEDKDIPPFGFALDYITFSGIYREVYLVDEPKTYLSNIYVHGDMNGNVNVLYDVNGEDKVQVKFELYDEDKLIKESNSPIFKVESIKLWDLDNPKLYTLKPY